MQYVQLLATGAGWVAPSQHTIPPFRLLRPDSIAEAVAAHTQSAGSVYAAGCTDLVAQLREGLRPEHVVSLRRVAELRDIRMLDDDLMIGSGVDHYRGSSHPLVVEALPGLGLGWSRIATVRVRRRGTIGGNIMARRHRYEMAVQLDALGAELQFATAAGRLRLRCSDVWDGMVPVGALLTGIRVPLVSRVRYVYDRSLRPTMGIAAAVRDGRTIRVAVGSEYRRPAVVEVNGVETVTSGAAAAALVDQAVDRLPDWISDAAAGATYRRRATAARLRALWPLLAGAEAR